MTGMPIWYELMTPDIDAVRDFYRAVIGWEIPASGSPVGTGAMDYRAIQRADGGMAGGALQMSQDMLDHGARPGWLAYFHVEDVPATVARLEALGGKTHMPPRTIDVGTMAMVSDPQGAPFYVMDPIPPADNPDARSDVWDRAKAGHCRWNELATTDAPAAKAFYTELLGWKSERSMPMGERGDYLFLECEGNEIGAINPWIGENQPPMWLFYLGVDSIARALDAAKANGGSVINGPHEVPGGDHVFVATDPAGAMIAFVGPKGE
jgi:predicted enzyme related to lactoylglutathione lyase